MGKGMHLSEELVQVKEEISTTGLSFEEQCAALQERMHVNSKCKVETPVGPTSHGHTLMLCSTTNPTTPSSSMHNVDTSRKEPIDAKQSASGQIKSLSKELKNWVTLQRIRLSQIRDGMNPTVADQGIVFDEDNNPWVLPPSNNGHDSKTLREQHGPGDGDRGQDKSHQDNEPGRNQHGHDRGDPGDGGSNSSNDKGSQKDVHNPFTPRFQSRMPSLAPTARSLEVKAQHIEWKFQQIIEFIQLHLEHKLAIPDGAKGTHLDTKTMKKYDGTASCEVLWEWLCSVVFAYRTLQLGGPDHDEQRVLILDLLLEGKAKTWFQQKISQPGMMKALFMEIIIDLYA